MKSRSVTKRVLFVSYYYPPDSEIGAKRTAKLAKFLMENGWQVGVLTVQERFRERIDRSYDVPGVDVYSTGMFQNLRFALPRAKRLLARLKRAGGGGGGGEAPADGGRRNVREASKPEPAAAGAGSSLFKRFMFSMLWLPDDRQGWVPFGLRRFLGLLSTYPLAYSSSPPESTHLIPLFASYLTRKLTWVAEFRDPWTTVPKPLWARTKLGDWLEERWEAATIARSARVVVVTEAMRRDLAEKYPGHADKIRLYSNGFDRDEFASLVDAAGAPANEKATFVYAGQFAYGRNPRTFLQAMSELIDDGALAREKVRVVFMSNTDIDGESVEEMVQAYRLDDVVQCVGYVPYDRCVREMSRADVLLLFSIDQPLQVPAKVYEYLALNKRILSITTGGITEQLIDRTGSGLNVRPNDLPAMKEAIRALVSGGGPPRNEREIDRFNIRSVVRSLAEDLGSLK